VREQHFESDCGIFSEFNLMRLSEISTVTKFLGIKLYNYYVTVPSTFNTNYIQLLEERRVYIFPEIPVF
jgi:hypothetical protein